MAAARSHGNWLVSGRGCIRMALRLEHAKRIWPTTSLSRRSSTPRRMLSADAEVYAALGKVFDRLGVRWYVFGAQAAILYGAARFTEDIDVTVELGTLETSMLVSELKDAGFSPRLDDPDFIHQTRVIPVLHATTKTPLDIVLAGPGIEELFFDGARRIEVGGELVPVASPEDLVVMKVLAGRPKDLEDVVAVLAAQDPFDEKRARWLLSLLQQALDQTDLLPSFERCLARVARARGRRPRDP